MAVIGGFRSDMSIARKTDGNFGNVSAIFFVFQSRVSTETVVRIPNFVCGMFLAPPGIKTAFLSIKNGFISRVVCTRYNPVKFPPDYYFDKLCLQPS